MRLFLSNSDAPPPPENPRKRSSLVNSNPSTYSPRSKSAIMATPADPKQEDMFQSIGDRVNEVSSGGNNVEVEENFTVDEPQIVDNIGILTPL